MVAYKLSLWFRVQGLGFGVEGKELKVKG